MKPVRLLVSPFGLAALCCLALAGAALWSAGLLDGPVARTVRTSSVYAAPGVDLDRPAAERVIGNRRLVVALLEPGADLRAGCDGVRRAASGTLALMLSRADDGYDTYSCALLRDARGGNLGRAATAELTIANGVDEFADRPIEALKVVVVNYDLLVRAGIIPDGARTVSPPLPRYLVAAAAIGAVLAGSALVYTGARRAGRLAAARQRGRDTLADDRSALNAAAAVLARRFLRLDREYAADPHPPNGDPHPPNGDPSPADARYRRLTAEYADLLDAIAAAGRGRDADLPALTRRVESLSARCHPRDHDDHGAVRRQNRHKRPRVPRSS